MPDNVEDLRAQETTEPVGTFLNAKLVELRPGYARVSLKIGPEHLNFNGLVFGGIIMSVVDEAFAYATNSLVRPSYASQINIHFLNGPAVDDVLLAECRVLKSGRRVGVSEMQVTNQDGKLIAKATGTTIPVTQDQARS